MAIYATAMLRIYLTEYALDEKNKNARKENTDQHCCEGCLLVVAYNGKLERVDHAINGL